MLRSLHFITASTSGNTEFVADVVAAQLRAVVPDVVIEMQKAELAQPDDLFRGDILILGSGTWNTGGTEGQLNMYMDDFLKKRAKDVDLRKKPVTFVSLGDDRYYFRTRCTEHFLRFQRDHNGTLFLPPLIIVNEPHGQEERINRWADKLAALMTQHEAGTRIG